MQSIKVKASGIVNWKGEEEEEVGNAVSKGMIGNLIKFFSFSRGGKDNRGW